MPEGQETPQAPKKPEEPIPQIRNLGNLREVRGNLEMPKGSIPKDSIPPKTDQK